MKNQITKESMQDEFNAIINAQNYHKAQMLKQIIYGMDVHVSNLFDEIENIYSSGYQIPQDYIEELVKDIRKSYEAIELYLI